MELLTDGQGNCTIRATGVNGLVTFLLRDGRFVSFEEISGRLYRDGAPFDSPGLRSVDIGDTDQPKPE